MNFDEKYEEILDTVTEGIYELADTFAEEQVHNFAKWLEKHKDQSEGVSLETLAAEFIQEQRS